VAWVEQTARLAAGALSSRQPSASGAAAAKAMLAGIGGRHREKSCGAHAARQGVATSTNMNVNGATPFATNIAAADSGEGGGARTAATTLRPLYALLSCRHHNILKIACAPLSAPRHRRLSGAGGRPYRLRVSKHIYLRCCYLNTPNAACGGCGGCHAPRKLSGTVDRTGRLCGRAQRRISSSRAGTTIITIRLL